MEETSLTETGRSLSRGRGAERRRCAAEEWFRLSGGAAK